MSLCGACIFFDCNKNDQCSCECHKGSNPKIRQDLDPHDRATQESIKTEQQAMEGLSALFG